MKYTIDATEKKIGRVASEAAAMLMGKNVPSYERHRTPEVEVHIVNASKVNVSEKKRTTKVYSRYSGYPGGLHHEAMEEVIKKKGYTELFRKAVYGMLPSNKLRSRMMKRLVIIE